MTEEMNDLEQADDIDTMQDVSEETAEPVEAVYPVVALRGTVIMPYMESHLDVGRMQSLLAIRTANDGDKLVLLVPQREAKVEEPTPEDLYDYGVVAEIRRVIQLPADGLRILVRGIKRVRLTDYVEGHPYLLAHYEE